MYLPLSPSADAGDTEGSGTTYIRDYCLSILKSNSANDAGDYLKCIKGYNKVMSISSMDGKIIDFFRRISLPFARFSIFVIFFWFGLLKVVGLSPASDLVSKLFERTISFMTFHDFFIFFGLFEVLIGILFLIRGMERIVIFLLFIHMVLTLGPLVLLPDTTWSRFMVPTLEGQYIIKNLAIMASAIFIASNLRPVNSLKESARV